MQFLELLQNNATACYLTVAFLSLCIGSFLNVVIFRTPKMMEQEWHTECQMLLHPEQPIIDHEKLKVPNENSLVSKYPCNQLAGITWEMWNLPKPN